MKFFTIGYGGRKPQDLIALLRKAGVRTVVDVRLRPDRTSMGFYAKAKSPDKGIEGLLNAAGIGYRSLPELGNLFLDSEDWPRLYEELIQKAGALLTRRLREVAEPFCLMCAEKRVAECHRRMIADFLVVQGHEVEHLE
jgi:uncharacterized protein (DUF488 family)